MSDPRFVVRRKPVWLEDDLVFTWGQSNMYGLWSGHTSRTRWLARFQGGYVWTSRREQASWMSGAEATAACAELVSEVEYDECLAVVAWGAGR